MNKILKSLLAVLSVFPFVICHAQDTLSLQLNLMRNDSLYRQCIEYFDPGRGGTECLWDFSRLRTSDKPETVYFKVDSLGRIISEDAMQACHYWLSGDTLMMTGYESRLRHASYNIPILRMKYPFTFSDSISSPFMGSGVYCGDHVYREQGEATIIGDGFGKAILPSGDTLRNVLRVYSLISYVICMDIDSLALDTARLKQVIEERYEWYVRGFRYPVVSMITSTSYADMSALGTKQTAFCCLPDEQLTLNDSINHNILIQDSVGHAQQNALAEETFHYTTTLNGSKLNLQYSLDADARIVTLLCNAMGVVYRRHEWTQLAGEGYAAPIDCSGLHRGQYILYINVNGKVYSEKIIL